jgi:hypothetical protein
LSEIAIAAEQTFVECLPAEVHDLAVTAVSVPASSR